MREVVIMKKIYEGIEKSGENKKEKQAKRVRKRREKTRNSKTVERRKRR